MLTSVHNAYDYIYIIYKTYTDILHRGFPSVVLTASSHVPYFSTFHIKYVLFCSVKVHILYGPFDNAHCIIITEHDVLLLFLMSVNGQPGPWTEWTLQSCSVSCGIDATRTQSRTRQCNNPSPAFGGSPCTESLFDSRTTNCGLQPCPSKLPRLPTHFT